MLPQGAVLVFLVCAISANNTTVDYYVNLISKTQEFARNFEPGEDAMEFESPPNTTHFGTYDYIIIGAGAAGAVVANRLSEIKDWNILLLEAGYFENDFTDIPGPHDASLFTPLNWAYKSTPQKTACLGMVDQKCLYPRGKVVGGSTVINGLVYARGNPYDYDRWESLGNPGWSYEDVLPYFKKSENSKITDGDLGYHGTNGPLSVEYASPFSPHLTAFLSANKELGREIVDYNGKEQLGVSPTQLNTVNGRRDSTGKAFINTVLYRQNLHVLPNSYVTKILIKPTKVACGVEFSHQNKRYTANAKHEVIVSAGSIGSPQILQLSGIGPREVLEKVGIPVVEDIGVGRHLKDHPTFYGLVFETNYTEPVRSLEEYVSEYLEGEGPLTWPANTQGVGFFQTPLALHDGVPDLEMILIPANNTGEFTQRVFGFTNASADAVWGNSDTTKSFSIYVTALHSISEGTIKITSSNPFEYPEIDSRFLSDAYDRDINTLYEGVQMTLELMKTRAFRGLNATLAVKPLPACSDLEFISKDYWYCAIRQLTTNVYHPIGTCQMGPNPSEDAVVDNNLRVHGIKNLRVADASVIPITMACHTAAPTIMIGEVAADLIKKDRIKEELNTPYHSALDF